MEGYLRKKRGRAELRLWCNSGVAIYTHISSISSGSKDLPTKKENPSIATRRIRRRTRQQTQQRLRRIFHRAHDSSKQLRREPERQSRPFRYLYLPRLAAYPVAPPRAPGPGGPVPSGFSLK